MGNGSVEGAVVSRVQTNWPDSKRLFVNAPDQGNIPYNVAISPEFECPITTGTKVSITPSFSSRDCRACPANPNASLSVRATSELGMSGMEIPLCPAVNNS